MGVFQQQQRRWSLTTGNLSSISLLKVPGGEVIDLAQAVDMANTHGVKYSRFSSSLSGAYLLYSVNIALIQFQYRPVILIWLTPYMRLCIGGNYPFCNDPQFGLQVEGE